MPTTRTSRTHTVTRDRRIVEIAERQHGAITGSQLLAAGLTPGALKSRVRSGALRRMHRGVYLLGHLHGSLEPPRAREMAAVLACGGHVVVSHRSAIGIWKLGPPAGPGLPSRDATTRTRGHPSAAPRRHAAAPPTRRPRQPVDVSFPGDRTPSRRVGIRAHRAGTLEPGDAMAVDGIPVTSPARTLLDFAAVASSAELERAVARAERQGLVDGRQLRALVVRSRGRRGARLLRALIEREGGARLTRSEAESQFLELLRGSTIQAPEANVVTAGYEVDFLWREHGVAVEVDGFTFHRTRPRFENDRRRDADLLAAGIRTVRFTWQQIVGEPRATLVRLTRVLARAADRSRDPPHP